MKKLQKSKHLREICSLFGTDGATQAQISEAGLSLFAVCYGGNAGNSLNHCTMRSIWIWLLHVRQRSSHRDGQQER